MTGTPISRVWNNRIEQDALSEGQIRQFCQAIMPLATGEYPGGKATNLTAEEARDIVAEAQMRFDNGGYELEERHTVKGYDWLQANGLRSGIPLEPIAGFLHFRWVGTSKRGTGFRVTFLPVWEITYRDNLGVRQTYEYSHSPYQESMYA